MCRLLPIALTALSLVAGCSSTGRPQDRPATPAAAHIDSVTVRLPAPNRPLYGERQGERAWRTSGFTPRPVDRRPYTNGLLTEGQLEHPVDEEGVRLYERDGKRYYHPVAIAQYALAQLDVATRTGDEDTLESAAVNAAKLIEVADRHDGGLYFPYGFDFSLGGNKKQTIHAPWWSAMAQGQALSLFVRLHRITGEARWRDAADRTFKTLDDRGPREEPWSIYVDQHHYLWFEEYAGDTKPLLVLNGHMFAIFGLWDYHRLTKSPKAKVLFDGGVTLLREYLPLFRVDGEASYYCIRAPLCLRPSWQDEKYHGIVIKQMRIIGDMADDRWFVREARRFRDDFVARRG
jgi:hypothetical protein